jgi:serine/threonine protein kinase
MAKTIKSFDFKPGRRVGRRYVVEARLGGGTEGEVYRIREQETGIVRAAKLYFPHSNPKSRRSIQHARKLNALRHCPIVLQYHHSEVITVRKQRVVALVSDLCEGEQLGRWIARHRGKRLTAYQALHVLYNLARGIEAIHLLGEYHADVHTDNILIKPVGVRFDLTLIDFYDWGPPAAYKRRQDIRDTIEVFCECLGNHHASARMHPDIRYILGGRRRDVIFRRFPTMTALRQHLESFEWSGLL